MAVHCTVTVSLDDVFAGGRGSSSTTENSRDVSAFNGDLILSSTVIITSALIYIYIVFDMIIKSTLYTV